ncbi:MAG: hypothetical protein PHS79_01785 [Patescibacteria group bacterium]|nr:hypothetical protein [Patescibacteria group bacterium]
MTHEFKGTIVEESLQDNRILNDLHIIGVEISQDENPANRWHMYSVLVTREDIERLSVTIKPKWYMHFWKDRDIVAIFQGKQFEFNYDDKSTWAQAVEYGLSQGIPKEQLDFLID